MSAITIECDRLNERAKGEGRVRSVQASIKRHRLGGPS